jgi:hypothetical protein
VGGVFLNSLAVGRNGFPYRNVVDSRTTTKPRSMRKRIPQTSNQKKCKFAVEDLQSIVVRLKHTPIISKPKAACAVMVRPTPAICSSINVFFVLTSLVIIYLASGSDQSHERLYRERPEWSRQCGSNREPCTRRIFERGQVFRQRSVTIRE